MIGISGEAAELPWFFLMLSRHNGVKRFIIYILLSAAEKALSLEGIFGADFSHSPQFPEQA